MNERDVLEVLAVPAETPWFGAMVAVLEDQEREASAQASSPGTLMHANAALVMAHCAGGAEWLRATRQRLEDTRDEQWRRKVEGNEGMRE